VLQLARRLSGQGLRVGLIDNDQGERLVDTALLSAQRFPVEEIAGGCFCCRFNSLVEAAERLAARNRPDVFLAEPVGSCTDLAATVTYPLRRLYGDNYTIAPVSVLVDPVRALRVHGLEPGARFSDKVVYIYRKQLEEADLIVINKRDLVEQPRLETLRHALARAYPHGRILEVSARHGTGLEAWFDYVTTSEQQPRQLIDVDYGVYAEGEARLGWINAAFELASECEHDPNELLRVLAGEVQRELDAVGTEIAHLKMTIEPLGGLGGLAVVNLVRNDVVPELSHEFQGSFKRASLVINLRAEADPETLDPAMKRGFNACLSRYPALVTQQAHFECFKPGKPVPTHRLPGA
jgi:G3E family GTPase